LLQEGAGLAEADHARQPARAIEAAQELDELALGAADAERGDDVDHGARRARGQGSPHEVAPSGGERNTRRSVRPVSGERWPLTHARARASASTARAARRAARVGGRATTRQVRRAASAQIAL